MLQMVATIASLFLLATGAGVIASSLSQDWALMMRALGVIPRSRPTALAPRLRPVMFARQIRVVRIRPQSAPLRAVA